MRSNRVRQDYAKEFFEHVTGIFIEKRFSGQLPLSLKNECTQVYFVRAK